MKFVLNKLAKMLENINFPIKYRGNVPLTPHLRNIWKKLFEMLREKATILTVNLRTRPNEKYSCKVD